MSNFGSDDSGTTDKKVIYLLGKKVIDPEVSWVGKSRVDEAVIQVVPVAAFTSPEGARRYYRQEIQKVEGNSFEVNDPPIQMLVLDPPIEAEEIPYVPAGLVHISKTGYMPRQPSKINLPERDLGRFVYGYMTYSIPYCINHVDSTLSEFQNSSTSLGGPRTHRMLQVAVPGSSFLDIRDQAMIICRRLDLAAAWDNDERTADVINLTRKTSSLWKARR